MCLVVCVASKLDSFSVNLELLNIYIYIKFSCMMSMYNFPMFVVEVVYSPNGSVKNSTKHRLVACVSNEQPNQ